MTASGATSLRDAVHLALKLQPRDRSRPLMLLFTDGHDTASWLTEDAVVDSARRVGRRDPRGPASSPTAARPV